MADEYIRELREEIKTRTAEMLQNADASHVAASEETCEFVELAVMDTPEKAPSKRNNTEQKKSPKVYNRPDIKSSEELAQEMTRELEKVKAMLAEKKAICEELDGRNNHAETLSLSIGVADGSVSDDSAGSDGGKSEQINEASSGPHASSSKERTEVDPTTQQQFSECKQNITGIIKNLQNRVEEINISAKANVGDRHTNNARGRSDSVSSVQSSTPSAISNKKSGLKNELNSKKNKKSVTPSNKHEQSTNNSPKPGPSTGVQSLGSASPDMELILTLLTLSPTQRQAFLVNVGKKHSLLVPTADGTSYQITDIFIPIAKQLKVRALKICYPPKDKQNTPLENISRPSLPVQGTENNQPNATKKIREKRTYEEDVSYVLNNGKTTEKHDYEKELTLENVHGAEINGYLTKPNRAALAELVDRLVAKGIGYLIEGTIRVNGRNQSQAFVDDPTRESDVFLNTILIRKCAMEGDLVKVFVKHGTQQNEQNGESDSGEKLTNNWGFVVEILEKRHSRKFIGSFMKYRETDKHYLNMLPRDDKIPVVRIYKQNWPEAIFKNDFKDIDSVIYQAEIIEWRNDVPVGAILKSVGKCGELEVENQSILMEYELDVSPYSEAIINALPPSPFQIPEEEIRKRIDLRDECVFTIDPLTARDLDDALSCKLLKNGNYEIGVHISDVSYFLKEGSELDELVKLRATSIYMVDNVYHMLPRPLCFLCSLLPGEDKLTFSVFWEITPNAKILNTRFAKTVINSCTQLAYEHAQTMLDRPNEDLQECDFPKIYNDYSPNYISRIVNQLQSIAVQLRARRMENGCLKINQPKLTFALDPNSGKPTAFSVYQLRPANQMIEDFMLLANSSVAEFTHSKFADISILRHHFPPCANSVKGLVSFLAKHGYKFEMNTSKKIVESLKSVVFSCEHPDAAQAAMNVLLAKPMTRASYFCSANISESSAFYHYALAIPMYTHFTSPIRRYADCMVHRVLTAALELSDRPARTPSELSKLTNICNEKKYNAKMAGDASSLLYFKFYMRQVKSFDTEAAVLDILPFQIEIVLISTGHTIKVSHRQLAKTVDIKVDRTATPILRFTLITKNKKTPPTNFKLFSKVRVTVQLVKDELCVTHMAPAEKA